jgi:hypothetical protein
MVPSCLRPGLVLLAVCVAATTLAWSSSGAERFRGRDGGGPAAAFLRRAQESRREHAVSRVPSRGPALHGIAEVSEHFESSVFPPAGWSIINPDVSSITWEHASGVSGFGNGSGSAWMDFYSYDNGTGHRDELRTPVINGLAGSDSLTFDYAYAEFDDPFAGPDSLLIRLSTNGGATFPLTLFADGGASLATAAATTLPFSPAAGEWRTVRLGLPPSVAGSPVVASFTTVNGFGNNLYVDNVLVGTVPATDIQALLVLSPADGSKQRTVCTPRGVVKNAGTGGVSAIPTRFQILSPGGTLLYDNPVVVGALAPGGLDTVTYPVFTVPGATGLYTARLVTRLTGDQNPGNDTAVVRFMRPGSIAGLITVGPGGMLPTLRSAVDTLNHSDVTGSLTFRLTASVYNETGPLTLSMVEGTSASAPVTIVPAPGLAVTVNVPGTPDAPYALAMSGSSYVTVDGGEPPASLTINATGVDGAAAMYVAGLPGRPSGHNTLRNLVLHTAADSTGTSSGFFGVLFAGYDETQKDTGNTITGCTITRHGQAGVAAQNAHALRIEACSIRDWVQYDGFQDLRGIWLSSGATAAVVRRNSIGNIRNLVNGWWAFGIENGAGPGSGLFCSNNSVWGIASTGAGTDRNIAGGIWSSSTENSGDRYAYNAIFLYGTESSTAAGSHSAAMEFAVPAPSGLRIRNTVGVNITQHSGGGGATRAYGVYLPASSWPSVDTCNRNDWWTPGPGGATGYFNGAVRSTLAAWRSATGQDAASMSADPRFVNGEDLHVALGTSPLGNAGVPVDGESEDIDGEPRNAATPDIGCDEFGPTQMAVAVPLLAGWNMIANPVISAPGRDSVRTLFAPSLFPYAFAFSPVSGYQQRLVMSNGRGYWEKFPAAGFAYPSGNMLLLDTIAVEQGWNMVGSIGVPVDTASVLAIPAGLRASLWFGYAGGYAAVDTLVPGRAFWVKASTAGRFILQGAAPAQKIRNSGGIHR